jgi:hypothetical protein
MRTWKLARRITERVTLGLKALTAAVLLSVVATCSDVAPTNVSKLSPPDSALNYPPKPIDWFICHSADGGQTFTCAFSHTEYESMNVDRWDYLTDAWWTNTSDCLLAPEYCGGNLFGAESPYPDRATAIPAEKFDVAPEGSSYPKCPPVKVNGKINPLDAAWCKGKAPSELQTGLIREALTRMTALGGRCALLADLGFKLISRNYNNPSHPVLRVFTQSTHTGGGFTLANGALPQFGGPDGQNSWVALGNHYFGFPDADNASVARPGYPYRTTIQWALAHELDHLLGPDKHHVINNGVEDKFVTDYTKVCSDVAHLNPTAPGATTP